MAYRIKRTESLAQAVRRIAEEQLTRAIDEVEDGELPVGDTVHQVRKRCKKTRGLIRLVRPALGSDYRLTNARLRDAAARLSPVRDARAHLETLEALGVAFPAMFDGGDFAAIEAALRARARDAEATSGVERHLDAFVHDVRVVVADMRSWRHPMETFDTARNGLRKTYRRGRRAMAAARAEPTAGRMHEWRKRAKYHWYHLRLLHDAWPPVVGGYESGVDALGTFLGDEHDLAMLDATLASPPNAASAESVRALRGLATARRRELREEAWRVGARLYQEKPARLARRLGRWWGVWRTPSQLCPGAPASHHER